MFRTVVSAVMFFYKRTQPKPKNYEIFRSRKKSSECGNDQSLRLHVSGPYCFGADGGNVRLRARLPRVSLQRGKTGETTLSVSGWIVLLAPLAIVLFTGGLMKQLSAGAMMIVFVFFCALMGASLSSVFLVYTEASIMMCFVTASATFGAMALFGLTTQTDLTSWGSVLLMALFGLIVAMVVNIFFKSAAMDFVISLVAVVVFCALTAYDSRKIREELDNCYDDEEAAKIAIWGALSLYLDFVNLLLHLLRLFGQKK